MSATDELRRLLDERAVEWWEDAFDCKHRTIFDGENNVRYCIHQLGCVLFISSALSVTPEQAVKATLGSKTCKVDHVAINEYSHAMAVSDYTFDLSCGHSITWDEQPEYCPWCGAKVVEE